MWDNLNTHRAQSVWDDFNARHDHRFVFHFTPLHASWVNQIALMFGIYSRRVLHQASHSSIETAKYRNPYPDGTEHARSAATAAAIDPEGWFNTGDRVRREGEGAQAAVDTAAGVTSGAKGEST